MMGNSIVTAIANGSAPYLAHEVKNQIQGNRVESDIQRTIKILSETLTDVKGITHITYQIPTKDRTGKLDGGYKNEIFEKTVYDPKVFSDQRILDLGQKASAKGYKEAMNSRDGQATATVDGVSFRIYIDKTTGKVRNFHPN
ncbi:CdiA family toxin C-terminal domain-containing protein [Proteus vulgaris]|uniref:CdiA family toxin C-terminal domain-containing protein n=1 Tax=Proteus vulgaris TaxID=585 RepID=UPI003525F179